MKLERWIVVSPFLNMGALTWTIANSKEESIALRTKSANQNWLELEYLGYRCVPCTIKINE